MKKLNWKWRFIHYLRDNISKTPPEMMSPKWIKVVYYILFPLNWLYEKQSNIKYDPLTGSFDLMGLHLTRSDILNMKS